MVGSIGNGSNRYTSLVRPIMEKFPDGIKVFSNDGSPLLRVVTPRLHPTQNAASLQQTTTDAIDNAVAKNEILPLVLEKKGLKADILAITTDSSLDQASAESATKEKLSSISIVDQKLSKYAGTNAYSNFINLFDENGNSRS